MKALSLSLCCSLATLSLANLASAQADSSAQAQAQLGSWLLLPRTPQHLQPYLASIFSMSDSCLQPAPFSSYDFVSETAQSVKSRAAEFGLRYDLTFTFNYSSVAPSISGQGKNFTSSNNELWAAWTLAKSADGRQGVFLMLEADWGQGFNFNENKQSAQMSLGSLSNPQSALRGGEGVFIPNLSLGYSGW
ncbi:MAG: hypothetical protein R3Y56_11310, partial [Akkermansia sp.]